MGQPASKPPAEAAGPFGEAELERLRVQWQRASTDAALLALFSVDGAESVGPRLVSKFRRWDTFPSTGPPTSASAAGEVSFERFVNGVASCTRTRSSTALRVLWDVTLPIAEVDTDQPRSLADLCELFRAVYLMARAAAPALAPQSSEHAAEAAATPSAPTDEGIKSHDARRMASSVLAYAKRVNACLPGDRVAFDLFAEWCASFASLAHLALAGFVQSRCLPGMTPPSSASPLALPWLDRPSGILSKAPARAAAELLPLWLHCSDLQGEWRRLYTSVEDGMSFNRLLHAVKDFDGPSLLLLQDDSGEVFGGFAATGWRVSNGFTGNSGCFLFKLAPSVGIYRSRMSSKSHFMYLNDKGFSLPHGLGFGGDVGQFRLFVPESLEGCTAGPACMSFENGCLRSTDGDESAIGGHSADADFDMRALEVWGCGGAEALAHAAAAQAQSRAAAAHAINKARQVDKAKFLGSEFDREMFLGKTFAGGSAQSAARTGNA